MGRCAQVTVDAWEAKMERLTAVSSELERKADLEPRARKILAGTRVVVGCFGVVRSMFKFWVAMHFRLGLLVHYG